MLRRATKLFEMVGVNAVPVVGVIAGDWSSATGLSVYWVENMIAALLVSARLWLYRRWTAGVTAPESPIPDSEPVKPLAPFLVVALPFTIAHGVMLAVVFFLVTKLPPDFAHLRQAATVLMVMQGITFGIDLWSLPEWPAARVNQHADHVLGRIVLVHLSIIIGMALAAWLKRPWAFFVFFAVCKVLADAASLLPRATISPRRS